MQRQRGQPLADRRRPRAGHLPHHEVAIEQTFVLEGSFADHLGGCPAGSRHDAWTDEGYLMLAFFLKPNTFFD
jgi:hypothetical protein